MKRRVLFVGHSDTRITPLCAAIMKYLCINKGVENIEFLSSGFWAMEGQPVHSTLLTSAGEIGIDLSSYKAHYVTMEEVKECSVIVPQDSMIARGISDLLGEKKDKLQRPMNVYDPSNGSLQAFRQSRDECIAYCEKLLKKLISSEKEKSKVLENIQYRPVTIEEASLVLPLEEVCFSHPWTLENIQAEIEKENSIFWGAFYQEQLLGYASCYLAAETAFMNNVGVHPEYRQLGIAETLMGLVEAQAKEKGSVIITLEVRSKNIPAISLYEKLRYKNKGLRRFFYRDPVDDANIMAKMLFTDNLGDGIISFK